MARPQPTDEEGLKLCTLRAFAVNSYAHIKKLINDLIKHSKGNSEQMTNNKPHSTIIDPQSSIRNSNIAISVKNLSKKYQLYQTPKHRLKEALHPFKKKYHREFWALRDVSFEARHGETVGIIGCNGSGKSTLLQMICGTLTPTQGDINVNGRISALLELGAGFNREFTGRENVYMNGAIFGLSRAEMDKRYQYIVDFAGIGNFIDQPVKTYSSGMYVRLAFAVAINVDPEILIVDEALAVGDAKFQRKCYAKLEEFRKRGKTILFVTHAMGTIVSLCNKAILLDKGKVVQEGEPKPIIKLYYKMLFGDEAGTQGTKSNKVTKAVKKTQPVKEAESKKDTPTITSPKTIKKGKELKVKVGKDELEEREKLKELALERSNITYNEGDSTEARYGNGKAEIIDFGILDEHGKKVTVVETGEKYTIVYRILLYEDLCNNICFNFQICDKRGISLYLTGTSYQDVATPHQKKGDILEIRSGVTMWLAPGDYFLTVGTASNDGVRYDVRRDVFHFKVTENRDIGPNSLVNLDAKTIVRNLINI